jgi:hypothetical protein
MHTGEGGGRGAPHVPPQKTLKNCNIKMQKNTKMKDPLPDFLTTQCTPSKEFKNDCAFRTPIQIVQLRPAVPNLVLLAIFLPAKLFSNASKTCFEHFL